jgi:hypothetical protein
MTPRVNKIANKHASKYVSEQRPFKGNNLEGRWIGDDYYVVISYGWYPLYLYCAKSCEWYTHDERYSVSTSKQKSQARPEYAILIAMGLDNMKQKAGIRK